MLTSEGIYIAKDGKKNVLKFNGRECFSSFDKGGDSIRVDGDVLLVDGTPIAKASAPSPLKAVDGELVFGDVRMTRNEVINITETDYNTLLAGGLVAGYKRFDKKAIYNIVANVATAAKITYSVDNSGLVTFSTGDTAEFCENMILANAIGSLSENTEDLTETVENTACPNLVVRHFDGVVPVGGKINVRYFVDTQNMASWNYNTIHDTFTVIITTAGGSVTKRTTYAGEFSLETPAFSTAGETWFSIRCIDSNGVGGVTQYFHVLVRDAVTPNYYTMTDADLEQYGIVVDDDTVSSAISNKAALSDFFAAVKNGGYNGVVMLKHTYWVDYHSANGIGTQTYYLVTVVNKKVTAVEEVSEQDVISSNSRTYKWTKVPIVGNDWAERSNGSYYCVKSTSTSADNIVFPDEFTVDLNGATIAATQCNDLDKGVIINFDNNFDTHLINGCIKGNYSGFDFDTTSRRVGAVSPAEWLGVIEMNASKFCSYENLDISGSVGYDGSIHSLYLNIGTVPTFTDGKMVDISDGSIVDAEDMVVTNMLGVNANWSSGVIAFGRLGYGGYLNCGTQREIFASFYDSEQDYMLTIKTRLFEEIVIPTGASFVIFSGYGKVYDEVLDDGNDRDWKASTSRGKIMIVNPKFSYCNTFKDCYWHDTRTTAITNPQGKATLLVGCKYKDIAKEKSISDGGHGAVTALLGDLEDSTQWCCGWSLQDCVCEHGINSIKFHYARNVDIIGCSNIKISDIGGIESGFIEGNRLSELVIQRNRSCYHPMVVYQDNAVSNVSISYGYYDNKPVNWNNGYAEKMVTMVGCELSNKCSYPDLNLRDSINGNDYVD